MLIRILTATLLVCLLTAAVFAQDNAPKTASPPSEGKKAFEKLKTLEGPWQGKILDIPIDFTMRAASSGTVILHDANTSAKGPPKHEITMFYVEGDRLLATHYCDAGNRSRLEGKLSADEKSIEFSFIDVTGSTRGGYLKDLVITMIDADNQVIAFTFLRPDGKPMPLRGEFKRSAPTARL